MRLLLDANIFLEALLKQGRAAEALTLIESDEHELFISLFGLYSIGIMLRRRHRLKQWPRFLRDVIQSGHVKVLTLTTDELAGVLATANRLNLDFDDAYQYVTAAAHDLTLVSFDHDFDHTPRGRQTPQAINQLTSSNNPTSQNPQ